MLCRLRNFIRDYFTRVEYVEDVHPTPLTAHISRKSRTRSRRYRPTRVSPSERFIWGVVILLVALVGLVVLEVVYIAVTGRLSMELLTIISGLVGSLSATFLSGRKC